MAKALHGYLVPPDAREQASLLAENRRLQQRVRDLEVQVARLLDTRDARETREDETVPTPVGQSSHLAPV